MRPSPGDLAEDPAQPLADTEHPEAAPSAPCDRVPAHRPGGKPLLLTPWRGGFRTLLSSCKPGLPCRSGLYGSRENKVPLNKGGEEKPFKTEARQPGLCSYCVPLSIGSSSVAGEAMQALFRIRGPAGPPGWRVLSPAWPTGTPRAEDSAPCHLCGWGQPGPGLRTLRQDRGVDTARQGARTAPARGTRARSRRTHVTLTSVIKIK